MPNLQTMLVLSASTLCSLSLAAHADGDKREPHADIWLRPDNGALWTGSITEGTPGTPIDPIARVFGSELGEDPELPFATFEPGIQSLPAKETANGVFSFNIPGPLLAWNGNAFEATALTISIGFGPALVRSTQGAVEGFSIPTDRSGLLHDHYDFVLHGIDGADPDSGVYLLPIEFHGPSNSFLPSPTVWIVFNNGDSEESHEAALRHAELMLACAIDLNANGSVGAEDLALLLGAWGRRDAAADLDGNGVVDAGDLALLLGAWGTTCE